MSRRGTRMNWVGAFAPGTVGGRRAHPPKSEKIWWEKINEKEKAKAIRSAITATILKDIVAERGHLIPDGYPFILDDKFELTDKTKKIIEAFKKLKTEIENITKNPFEKQAIDYFDFISWIESKIENRSFAEIVKEKVKT